MKNSRFLTFALFLFVTQTITAQANFGLKTGINHNFIKQSVEFPGGTHFSPVAYGHIGAVANFPVKEKISVQTELLFTQRGARNFYGLDSLTNQNNDLRYKFSYISMPLLLVYKIGALNIEMGPEFAYLLTSKGLLNGDELDSGFSIIQEKFDLSLDIGVKYSFYRFFTQLRWQQSITPFGSFPLTDVNGELNGNKVSFSTRSVQFSFGYKL